ncbi:hypothetical protein ACFXPZ_37720 [Streptomyces sp. NPDC059101]|uniref:hypothetical protein n=1 Tax=Streptomyces sp. NPDC059101 TaxID=3346728 RepID=UPI003698D151
MARPRLLRPGVALHQAHKELDRQRLRELSAQQREVVAALVGQARRLVEPAGQAAERCGAAGGGGNAASGVGRRPSC